MLKTINRSTQSAVQLCVSQASEKFLSSSAEEHRIAHPIWLSPAPMAEVLQIRLRHHAPLSNRMRFPMLQAQSNLLSATPLAWRGNRRAFPVSKLRQPIQPCSHSKHARAECNFKFGSATARPLRPFLQTLGVGRLPLQVIISVNSCPFVVSHRKQKRPAL